MKIYLASSWRNKYHIEVLKYLRDSGFEVYDFKNPAPGDNGFSWKDAGLQEHHNELDFIEALQTGPAVQGFYNDFNAMKNADCCVLLLPSGRSAHLKAGYFVGANKPVFVFMPEKCEPELMYKMTRKICLYLSELSSELQRYSEWIGR